MTGELMEPIEAAILRTVLYADVFNFPLTAAELHHFLIHDRPITLTEIESALRESSVLQSHLEQHGAYWVMAGRGDLLAVRGAREAASGRLWPLAQHYGTWLARLPFVRMVALTGALSVRNAAHGDDDLDYLLITAAGRVWTARACAILLVRWARLRGAQVCPNYVLAETALVQQGQDIFLAHEVVQMVPLFGEAHYRAFRHANDWTAQQMPNALGAFYTEADQSLVGVWAAVKRLLEGLLAGRVGDSLERWEHQRKQRRFAQDVKKPHSAAQLDTEHVKGHFDDHGHPVLRRYAERLRELGLEAQVLVERQTPS
jgi:hypothetical protein